MTKQRNQYPGQCMLCKKTMNKDPITRHLKKCVEEHSLSEGRSIRLFHIAVEGSYLPMYWIRVEIPGAHMLYDLDRFLRAIWLECCDHMSCFTIEGQRYSATPFGDRGSGWGERSMTEKIYSVLRPGMKFTHEYDYGSTTRVSLCVVGVRRTKVTSPGVTLLARNVPPAWQCSVCGGRATKILASGSGFDLEALFCDACAEGGEDEYLPVVNSPRVGTCAYCG